MTSIYFSALRAAFLAVLTTVLVACGGGGSGDNASTAPNEAPTADAGADQTVDEQTQVTLEGSGNDPDGSISTYSWSQTGGTDVTLDTPDDAETTFTAPTLTAAEDLEFELTVTDDRGATATDTVMVTVNPVNADPTADAGPDQTVNEQAVVTLAASGADSDGTIDAYQWNQTGGAAVTLNNADQPDASFTAPVTTTQLVFDFEVTVTDNEGATATDSVRIIVNPVNAKPVANAGPDQSVPEQTLVPLAGSASDADGSIVSAQWTQTFGPAVTIDNSDQLSASFVSPVLTAPATIRMRLAVTDNEGSVGTDMVQITVNPVNAEPTVSAGPDQSVDEQSVVLLGGSASDADGSIASYLWSQVSGTPVTLTSTTLPDTSFTAPVRSVSEGPEDLVFALQVTDNEGGMATDTVSVTVNPVNTDPLADAGPDQTVPDDTLVTLDASASSDADGSVDAYAWSQLGGTAVVLSDDTAIQPTFTSPARAIADGPETLTFQVEVTDNEGATQTDTVDITVDPENIDPTSNAGSDQSVDEQVLVTLDGTASSDVDGTVDSYAWTQTAGTAVVLSDSTADQPTFTAPVRLLPDGAETLTFALEVTDNEGATNTDSVDVVVNPVNADPTADAGPDQAADEQTVVTLDGTSSSDADGTVDTYAWTQTSGTVVVLSDPAVPSPTFTSPVRLVPDGSETLTFQLEVTDNEGASAADTVDIVVDPVNQLPSANAGLDQVVDDGEVVTLDSSASTDADGTVDSQLWTQLSGPAVTIANDTQVAASFTAPNVVSDTVLVFQVEVTDNEGATDTDPVNVTVRKNTAPILATVGPRFGAESEAMDFGVSAIDAESPPQASPALTADLSSLPGTPSFVDNGDGTGLVSWTPPVGAATPSPFAISVTATDSLNGTLTDAETIVLSVAAAGADTGPFVPDGTNLFSIEAEHFDAVVERSDHQWIPNTTEPDFSGSSGMEAVPEDFFNPPDFENDSPRMDYRANFALATTYTVCVRGTGPITSSNSAHISLDGSGASAVIADFPLGGYGWVEAGTLAVGSTGVHTINIWVRESGSLVDKFVLKPTAGCPYADAGPAESARGPEVPVTDDFGDGVLSGWTIIDDGTTAASNWVEGGGVLNQSVDTNDPGGQDFIESYHLGSFAILDASLGRSDYRFTVDATPVGGASDDIGVLFRYTDTDNYYRFTLNSEFGFARLEKKVDGMYSTIARNQRGYLPNTLQSIVVEVEGSVIHVFVNGDPLFSAFDSSHGTGGVGLFSRGPVDFDNVVVDENDGTAAIVIAAPTAHTVVPGGTQDVVVTAITRNQPGTPSVEIQVDLAACGAPVESPSNVFTATCASVAAGDHTIDAILNDTGAEVVRDTNTSVAVGSAAFGSHLYDAFGDSITVGLMDNYETDNLALADQRTIGFQGWPGLLGDLLTTETGGVYPSLVINEGIRGDRASDALNVRLSSILERNPSSDRALVMLGTNDSNPFNAVPSGAGCLGAACDGTYKGYMMDLITELQAAGRSTVYVAILPPTWGNNSMSAPYANPLTGERNVNIGNYNDVIIDELSLMPGVVLGPDFFSCFLTATENRFSLYHDNLHPNALGYAFMAQLWKDALVSGPVVPPVDPCVSPIYILDDLSPGSYKQNLIDAGDEIYNDETVTVTSIPAELSGGRWIKPDNADRTDASVGLVTFDAGPDPVTVYIAYDPAGVPPSSGTHAFAAYAPSSNLTAAGGLVPQYDFVRATGVTGAVSIDGTLSAGAGAQAAYLVIVVK